MKAVTSVAHTDNCGNAEQIPWTKCTCECDGALHPEVSGSGYYQVFGQGDQTDRRFTAIPDLGGNHDQAILVYALAAKAIGRDVRAKIGQRVCQIFGHSFRLEGNRDGRPPIDVAVSQQLSADLLDLATRLRAGNEMLSDGEQELLKYLGVTGNEAVPVLLLLALVLCGYLDDTDKAKPIKRCVEVLRLPLLVGHVLRDPAGAEDSTLLARRLSTSTGHVKSLQSLGRRIRSGSSSVNLGKSGAATDSVNDHALCSALVAVVRLLNTKGRIIGVTADAISQALVTLPGLAEFGDDVDNDVVENAVRTFSQNATCDFSPEGLKVACQLTAIAVCPSMATHPDIEHYCLRPLAGRFLPESIKNEVRDLTGLS